MNQIPQELSKHIYLIRHGETEYNRLGVVQGCGVDTDLNEKGRRQARLFYHKYKDVPFQKIYTSTLKRTIQTVKPFIEDGIPVEHYAGLNEISWGEKDGKIVNSDDKGVYMKMTKAWKEGDYTACIDGGESPLDVQNRQKPVIDLILSRKEESPVLICMHGRAIRILLATLLEGSLVNMDAYEHHNVCLYHLVWNGKGFEVVKENDVKHLA